MKRFGMGIVAALAVACSDSASVDAGTPASDAAAAGDAAPAGDAAVGGDAAAGLDATAPDAGGSGAGCATFTYSCNNGGANQCADIASSNGASDDQQSCASAGGTYST